MPLRVLVLTVLQQQLPEEKTSSGLQKAQLMKNKRGKARYLYYPILGSRGLCFGDFRGSGFIGFSESVIRFCRWQPVYACLIVVAGTMKRHRKHFSMHGLHADVLARVRQVVSKKQHAKGQALFKKFAQGWLDAVMTARKELGIKGFCAVGGKSAQGKALYAKAKALHAA